MLADSLAQQAQQHSEDLAARSEELQVCAGVCLLWRCSSHTPHRKWRRHLRSYETHTICVCS